MTDVIVRRRVGSASLTSTMTTDVPGRCVMPPFNGPFVNHHACLHVAGRTSGRDRSSSKAVDTTRLYWNCGSIGPFPRGGEADE